MVFLHLVVAVAKVVTPVLSKLNNIAFSILLEFHPQSVSVMHNKNIFLKAMHLSGIYDRNFHFQSNIS
ncbi:hypothetical protein ACJW31_03G141800 [Castanea mollissima]